MAEVAAAVCGMTGASAAAADCAAEAVAAVVGEFAAVTSGFRVTFLASIRARCTATRSGAAAAAREVGVGSERAPLKAGEAPRDAADDEVAGGVIVCRAIDDPPTGLSKRVFCCAAAARVAMAGLHCCCCCLCCSPEMVLLEGAAEELDAPVGRRDVEGATDGVRTAGVAAAAEGLNAGAAVELADLLDAATVSVALLSSVFTSVCAACVSPSPYKSFLKNPFTLGVVEYSRFRSPADGETLERRTVLSREPLIFFRRIVN